MKPLFLLPLAALVLSACSSSPRIPEYECPLDTVAAAKCASVDQAYKASRSMSKEDGVTRVQSVFDKRVQTSAPDAQPFFQGQPSNYPEPSQNGMPVFQQPKVMRVWVAPYVDADGNLRSGEYTYFSTPGQWSYGDMRKPGAASGIFEPSRPGNLGFTATQKEKAPAVSSESRTPPKPAEPAANASQGATPVPSGAQSAPRQLTTGDPAAAITQPYQRLSNK